MDSGNVKKNYDQSINRPVVYLVPHTHYDAIWVFTKEDYQILNACRKYHQGYLVLYP